MKTRLLLLFTCFFIVWTGQAQSSLYDPLQSGYLTLGINGGSSYQSSDVRSRYNGFGMGLTLAKNLYYHPASPITADIRGRLLYARQYGLDGVPSYDIDQNIALNGSGSLDYLNYPANLSVSEGFVYQNHKTTVGELAAEGVLTWNTNRLGPGLFFSLFGGFGIDYIATRIDQENGDGEEYYVEYAQLTDLRAGKARRELKNTILDGNYETVADNLPSGGTFGFMPSLGLEAGIQFTPRFAISLGHRVTFSGSNLLDGQQWANSKNDWYHYTNLGLRWTLTPARKARGKGPHISIVYPSQDPFTSNTSNGLVRARISGVQSAADIVCTVNGQYMPFDYYGGDLNLSFPLVPGRNDVNIQASNPYGRDLERIQIYFKTGTGITPPPRPRPTPIPSPSPTPIPPGQKPSPAPPKPIPSPGPTATKPQVQITQPSSDPYQSQQRTTTIRATIKNVSSKSDVLFMLNGRRLSNFSFSGTNFQAKIDLQQGDNKVVIKGTNNKGTVEDRVTIIYDPGPPPAPPTVTITQPANNDVVSNPSMTVRASLKNIKLKSQITFLLNNRSTTVFSYSNGSFQATVKLKTGLNTLTIRAKNEDGQAEDEVQVTYRVVPKTPPTVTITQPADKILLKDPTVTVRASLKNINQKEQITFLVNNRRTSNFSFSKGNFQATVTLKEGLNTLTIRAENQDGNAEDKVQVTYSKPPPAPKPVVTFLQPDRAGGSTQKSSYEVKARIEEVELSNQITFKVNGKGMKGFRFNPNTGQFSATIDLKEGKNELEITATNKAGSDMARTNITYRKQVLPSPGGKPQITITSITQPASNPLNPNVGSSTLEAMITGVTRKNMIQFTINGKAVNNYTFDAQSGKLEATLLLERGRNDVYIKATNRAGSGEARRRIDF